MGRVRKIKVFLLLLCLPLVITLYYNQIVNWHYHVMENGTIVKHAHPYKSETLPGTPYQKHQHTNAEFFFLALIAISATLLAYLIFLGLIFRNVVPGISIAKRQINNISGYFESHRLRGPPALA